MRAEISSFCSSRDARLDASALRGAEFATCSVSERANVTPHSVRLICAGRVRSSWPLIAEIRTFHSNGQENAMSNRYRHPLCTVALLVVLAILARGASAQGITGNKQGQGGSAIQGAAGTQGSKGAKGLEHCDKPMGAVAVVEPQDQILMY